MWAASLAQLGGNAPYCSYRPSILSVAVFAVQNDNLRLSRSTALRPEEVRRVGLALYWPSLLESGCSRTSTYPGALLDYAVSSVNSVNFRGNSSTASETSPAFMVHASLSCQCWPLALGELQSVGRLASCLTIQIVIEHALN